MKSVLNIEVSCTRNCYSNELVAVNLRTWLTSSKYKYKVDKVRAEQSEDQKKELKKELPCIISTGVWTGRSEGSTIVKYSNKLCLDIDYGHNKHIKNYTDLKNQLSNIKNVAYAGLSVSGNGYFVLFEVAEPDKHALYFEFLNNYLKEQHGIIADPACKDIRRLRIYSYDPNPYFNHQAVPLKAPPEKKQPVKLYEPKAYSDGTIGTLISMIQEKAIDITCQYADWYAIGCDLATSFGSSGEDYFHAISLYYPGYDYKNAAKQYAACLRAVSGKPSSLGALFNIARRYGLIIKDAFHTLPAPQKETKRYERLRDGSTIELADQDYPALWDQVTNENIALFGKWSDHPVTTVEII